MKIKDQAGWDEAKKNNKDPYGARILSYAEDWANLLEKEIEASGRSPAEVIETHANKFSQEADYDRITGFMYSMAVNTLFYAWEHGDLLRRWHNLRSQLGTEGEEANKKGTVLNTSIINISSE